jgi:Flp pilus assembly protein TadD
VTVIRHFKLRWCDASTRYRIGSEGRFTYPGHVLRYTGFVHDAELYRGQFLTTRDAASWAEGETLLRNALSRNPCNGEIAFALARNLARQDRHAEALPFANAAARDADAMGEPELQALRGAILDRIGRADDAAAALRLAAALSDDPARHFASLGRLHRKQGDHRKAVEAFQEAVASDPYDRRHAADLAAAAPSPSGKPSRSDPEPAEASLRRARALEAAGNADAALEAARHAVRLDPDHREAWQLIGRVAIKLWRLDDAEAAQRQLIRLDDADWHAWFSLAFALCRAKRFAEAEAAASRAIRLKTSDPFLHHVRGIALEQLGRLEEAEADVRQALELAPDTRLFQQQLATLKRQAASA